MATNLKLLARLVRTVCIMLTVKEILWFLPVSAQPGFLSIDCGGNANYTEHKNNISWVTDEGYIANLGRAAHVTNASFAKLPNKYSTDSLRSVRYFPKPLNKSCYRLPITPNVPYLLRAWFFFGNYSGEQRLPSFGYTLETKDMLFTFGALKFNSAEDVQWPDFILKSWGDIVYICLIRLPQGDDPFISAIELRPLKRTMYNHTVWPGRMLYLVQRVDMGARTANSITRYPQDQFDRIWSPDAGRVNGTAMALPENSRTTYKDNTVDIPPAAVMRTAIVAGMENSSIFFSLLAASNSPLSYLVLLYFAEIGALSASDSRSFDIEINGDTQYKYFEPKRTEIQERRLSVNYTTTAQIVLLKTSTSTRGPLINAFEHYVIVDTDPKTDSDDVAALAPIGKAFSLKDWISDPCYTVPWRGIKCGNSSAVRVLEINLAARNLSGSIPASIGQLTALRSLSLDNNHLTGYLPDLSRLTKLHTLHLQNNNLSGPLPEWLSELKNLKELFIDNNSFSGVIPQRLWDNYSSKLLNLSYNGNPNLLPPRSKNNKKVKVVLGSTLGGLLTIGLVFIISVALYYKKFRTKENANIDISGSKLGKTGVKSIEEEDFSLVEVPNATKSRAFSLEEMMATTENFSHKIGQGGFGSVYFGKLADGRSVAVKVLSMFSRQGVAEFLNEVDLLSRIHHKNLVSLLGYCNESRELMLIYEHMSAGSLRDHLYGPTAGLDKLDWTRRLKIALDAAQGLEYLHVGCTPKIIHRDVKTANILLDDILTGKLSDFGLSRMTIDDGATHVTTAVKGTAGYLDPEYFSTQMLTEKSDVYSFGVVLLEIICGRQPINVKVSEDQVNLIRWATPYVETNEDACKLAEIIDRRLQPYEYDLKSVSHIARLAIRCVQNEPSLRPPISEIVAEIRVAVEFQADSTSAVISEEVDVEYNDIRASPACTSMDSSAPRELGSTDSSYNTVEEARKLRIV